MATYQTSPEPRRRSLPVGTVTFLFTDIEGSTRHLSGMGTAAWATVLSQHRAIVRDALAEAHGIEVQTDGDSFFVVFERAPAALAAAVAAQRGLAAQAWPDGLQLRIRMGLHTGEGILDADGAYVGPDVHRAARIAAAAHGGQIVLSEAARALVAPALPEGVTIADLGEHRLKDLRPERLAEARIAGLPADFPPIRSIDSRPNNLPTQLTSFVGRQKELAEAAALLKHTRLLTLSGPGGTGKTRLSLQLAATAAEDHPGGVWFVALEPIRDTALVAPTIARAMGLALTSGRPAIDLVTEAIGGKPVLLVLDNFEQVVDAAPVVTSLLRACQHLRVIVTSRAALHVSGEQEYQVPGLPTPPDISRLSLIERENLPAALRNPAVETVSQFEAVRLFIVRAAALRPGFTVTADNAPAIAQICARLQGMPLAIELAAVRVKLLSPAQILARLERQLDLLSAGGRDLPARQQTLRGAIAWSYDLLDEPVQRFLARLSVFSGGWDLAAAEAISGAAELGLDPLDGLAALVDHSLVRQQDEDGEPRFEMFPTIREYAMERLDGFGEAEMMAERHAGHCLALAEEAGSMLAGSEQRRWLDRLEYEHDNMRSALAFVAAKPDPETAVRLAFALWRFWQKRGYLVEARARLEALVAKGWPLPDRLAGRLFEALGGIAYWQADHAAAIGAYEQALTIWQRIGDEREIANAIYNRAFADILPVMQEQRPWGSAPSIQQSLAAKVLRLADEALRLFRKAGDRTGEGNIMWAIGSFRFFSGEASLAEGPFREALAIFETTADRTMEAWARHMLALSLLRLERVDEACDMAQAALRHFHGAGDLAGTSMVLDDLAAVAVMRGDRPRAGRLRGAAQQLQRSTGTELATYIDLTYLERTQATVGNMMAAEEIARYGKEGAAMSLDQAVAFALEEGPPTIPGNSPSTAG